MANDVKSGVGFIIPALGVVGFFTSLLLGEFLLSIIIAVIAYNAVTYDQISNIVPGGWENLFFGWTMDLDWSQTLPRLIKKV